jgi:hypothetical protein
MIQAQLLACIALSLQNVPLARRWKIGAHPGFLQLRRFAGALKRLILGREVVIVLDWHLGNLPLVTDSAPY